MRTLIETSALTKVIVSGFRRERTCILEELTLSVKEGEVFGMLGLNGAGKTTAIKLMLGLIKPTSGEVKLFGEPAGSAKALAQVGFLPEHPYFYPHLNAREFLLLMASLFKITGSEAKKRTTELLELVSLAQAADKQISKFSKGMLQRLGVAQALINDPQLLFLDEPMSGLDPIGRQDVRRIIQQLQKAGKTVFFNSHLMPDIEELCDRIGIMHRGRLIVDDSKSKISRKGDYHDLENFFLSQVENAETRQTGTMH